MPSPTSAAAPARAGSDAALDLALVESEARLRQLAPEWDGLLAAMERPSPFLAWDWICTWWEQFGAGSCPWVVVARDRQGVLQGLAPLRLVRRRAAGILSLRSLEFLGYRGSAVCADHLDFLARPGRREETVAALVAEIGRRGGEWDVFVLADLAEDSPLPAAVAALPGLVLEERPGETCYFLALPGEVPALWADRKRHHPKLVSNVKYYRKRLELQHAVQFIPQVPATEQAATLEELARLHGVARGRKGETGNFVRGDYAAFHRALVARLAASGRLYLARLDCDGRAAAIVYGFVQGGVLYFYQSGFDTAWGAFGVGTLLLAHVIEDAVQRLHLREFDFLRGAEEYKTRWTSQARRTRTLMLWGQSPAAVLGWRLGRAKGRLAPWFNRWAARRRSDNARREPAQTGRSGGTASQ